MGTDVDVIDNLDSTDRFSALSANQGRVLRDKINDLVSASLDEDGNIIIMLGDDAFQSISL